MPVENDAYPAIGNLAVETGETVAREHEPIHGDCRPAAHRPPDSVSGRAKILDLAGRAQPTPLQDRVEMINVLLWRHFLFTSFSLAHVLYPCRQHNQRFGMLLRFEEQVLDCLYALANVHRPRVYGRYTSSGMNVGEHPTAFNRFLLLALPILMFPDANDFVKVHKNPVPSLVIR
jgi:hypothetical protein